MQTLDDLIRELAARGEITHISLVPHGKSWSASFAPAGTFGVSFAEAPDPVEALKTALTGAKLKRRSTKVEKPSKGEAASDADLESLGV